MVATIAQASKARFYLERQRFYRHPKEYLRGGEEPDGVWWNPAACSGWPTAAGSTAGTSSGSTAEWRRTAPANSRRTPAPRGGRPASNADKTVSALWAIADEGTRADVGEAHGDAARTALADIIGRYCGVTRVQDGEESRVVVPADILAAMFQQGASYEGDPQLYTHCVIFNVVRNCRDGRYRSLHQKPAYFWKMAAGAAYRNALAWNLRTRLGIRMEQYGPDGGQVRAWKRGAATGRSSRRIPTNGSGFKGCKPVRRRAASR